MGKLTSLIAGILVVDVVVYYFASSDYTAIINWLGPVFGFRLSMILGYIYIFFADPLKYPGVIVAWVSAGLAVSLGSRRALGSAGAAFSVYTASLGFLLAIIYTFTIPLLSGGSTLTAVLSGSMLPPAPPGTSVSGMLSSPAVNTVLTLADPFISPSASGLSASDINSYLYPLIFHMTENLAIFLASSSLFGFMFSGQARRRKKAKAAAVIIIAAMMAAGAWAVFNETSGAYSHGIYPAEMNGSGQLSFLQGVSQSAPLYANYSAGNGLYINISQDQASGGTVTVSTVAYNSNSTAVSGFNLNESSLIKDYGQFMSNETGNMAISAGSISPGAKMEKTFSFHPSGVGDYVIWNITGSYYTNGAQGIHRISIPHYIIHVSSPPFLKAYNAVEYDSLAALGDIPGISYLTYSISPGVYMFDLIVGLIVLLDIYIEARAYRKYKRQKYDL